MIRYTEDHEWLRTEEDGTATVGITEHAAEQLGDIVFVELPEEGPVSRGDEIVVIESVKAAADILAPADGEIVEVNEALTDNPGLVNEDPMGEGWFFRMNLANPADLEDLMTEEQYKAFIRKA